MKSWLNKNDIEMYSIHSERKSIVDESKRLCSKLVWRSFLIKKLKNTVPWTHVSSILKDEEIVGTFVEKNFKKWFRVEKVLKRKGDKLYIKWRGYDSSFNSWID